jgi:hypothetical protein
MSKLFLDFDDFEKVRPIIDLLAQKNMVTVRSSVSVETEDGGLAGAMQVMLRAAGVEFVCVTNVTGRIEETTRDLPMLPMMLCSAPGASVPRVWRPERVAETANEGERPSAPTRVCPYCGEEFTPARKDSTICAKAECRSAERKTRQAEYNRRYAEKMKATSLASVGVGGLEVEARAAVAPSTEEEAPAAAPFPGSGASEGAETIP